MPRAVLKNWGVELRCADPLPPAKAFPSPEQSDHDSADVGPWECEAKHFPAPSTSDNMVLFDVGMLLPVQMNMRLLQKPRKPGSQRA